MMIQVKRLFVQEYTFGPQTERGSRPADTNCPEILVMMNQTPGRPETVPDAICIVIITARDSLDPFEYILQIVCLSEKNECIYIVQMGIITREKFTVYRLGDFYMTGEKLLFYL